MSRKLTALLAALGFVYLLVMALAGGPMQQAQFVAFEAAGVLAADPAEVRSLSLHIGNDERALERAGEAWTLAGKPVPPALLPRVNLAVKFLHTAKPVRVLEGTELQDLDTAALGFDEQALTVTAQTGQGALTLVFGKPTPEGSVQYLRIAGQNKVVLMSRFVGEEWEAVWVGLH